MIPKSGIVVNGITSIIKNFNIPAESVTITNGDTLELNVKLTPIGVSKKQLE